MNYRVGQELYSVSACEDTGKCEMETYVVRTIRGGKVYATLKASFTWGKRSSRNGDYGWLDPVPEWCRSMTLVGHKFRDLETTKRQAWVACRRSFRDLVKRWDEDEEFVSAGNKIIATCTRMIGRS